MSRLVAAVVLLSAAAPAVAADYAVPPDHKMVYVSAKDGGIEAVDLASGKIIWSNKTASSIAGASNALAFAWVADEKKPNVFRILALDAMIGREKGTSDPIEMPEWATTARKPGHTFAVKARDDGDLAVVAWDAGAFYAGGAAPTPEVPAAAKKSAAGVVWVKLDTGKVTPLKDKKKDDFFKPAAKPGVYGDYTLTVSEPPPLKPGPDAVVRALLTVTKDGQKQWSRELAGRPWLPPPP